MGSVIRSVSALEILDSRGDPTLEVTIALSDGVSATAAVPSGTSTGTFEAQELRDGDRFRFSGRGVQKAVSNVNSFIQHDLIGMDPTDQAAVDRKLIDLDGTPNKRRLGANALLGVSLAAARVAALSRRVPLYRHIRSLTDENSDHYQLPVPLLNVINGGKHASTTLNIQEFWVIPFQADMFAERLRQGREVMTALGLILQEKGYDTDFGLEGGYAPDFESHTAAFDMIVQAVAASSLDLEKDIALGMDVGASVLYDPSSGLYRFELEKKSMTESQMIDFYLKLAISYRLAAIEDPLAEESWEGWRVLTEKMKANNPAIRIIGDDLFVTNTGRLARGVAQSVANSIIVKPNQIGTLTETLQCIALAAKSGYSVVISHRSGETNDTFIADLSVAVNAAYIKAGAPSRGERVAKYNRLLAIERELYGRAA